MAKTPDKCECGAAAVVCEHGLAGSVPDYYVYCRACDTTGPTRTRRIRAIDSWNDGRRLPMDGSGEDPFKVVQPHSLTPDIAIPGDQLDGASEAQVTAEVLDALSGAGFGHVKNGEEPYEPSWYMRNEDPGRGNTSGQPDLWIRHRDWPKGIWVAIELKARTRDAHLKPNQLVLAASSGIYVCWNAEMVLEAIQCTDKKVSK